VPVLSAKAVFSHHKLGEKPCGKSFSAILLGIDHTTEPRMKGAGVFFALHAGGDSVADAVLVAAHK
jgi:hypothetical protein